jgi:hypothetical protein
VGKRTQGLQDVDYILKLFASKKSDAIRGYREYVKKAVDKGRRPDLVGGGLVPSAGGWSALKALRRIGAYRKGDERILGHSDFVKRVLAQAKEDFEHVVHRVAGLLDLTAEQVLADGKYKERVAVRSLLCYWATTELAISQDELSQKLKISQPAVSIAVRRGEHLASRNNYSLKD